MRTVSEISVRHVALRHGSVTFDDRETKVFANIRDAGLRLRARLGEGHSMLALDFRNRNILFWQDGELLVNRVATRLRASVELDRAQRTLTLHDALLGINGTELDLTGTVRRDTAAAGALLLDLRYGLHAPSLETVLHMIPESVLKRGEVAADGEVRISGAVKGPYGRQALPLATLDAEIKDASARYAGMPYGVDALDARLVGQVDPMRREPSFCNLEIFRFRGAHTDILADAEVKNLLDDPLVSFHTKSAVDLTALAQTFPLQEGVALSGKLEAELRMSCRLSALRNRDLGRIRARGRVVMDSLALRDTARKFEFTSSASLSFAGDDRLDAEAEIRHASLRSPRLSSSMERLAATVRTTNPQDTTRIARMECTMTLNRLKASAGDSLSLFCGRGTATVRLQPGKRDPAKPKVGLALEADTLFCRVGDSRMGMDRAGIGVTAEKLRDSVWIPEGIVGFSRLVVSTPQCALPIRMEKTSVTVGNRAVTLRNATMRIGRSDLTASGRRARPLRRHAPPQAPARRAFAFVAESELQPTDPRRLVPGRHPAHRGGHRGHRSETLRRSEKHRLRAAHRLPPRALRQIRFRGRARRRGRPRRGRAPEGSGHEGAGCGHAHDAALPGCAARAGIRRIRFPPAAHQCRKAGRIHPVARQHRAHAAVVPGNGRFRWSRRRPIWTRRSTSGFRPFVRPSASGATASC